MTKKLTDKEKHELELEEKAIFCGYCSEEIKDATWLTAKSRDGSETNWHERCWLRLYCYSGHEV